MKKETVTAIILGILLGGVLAVVIIFKNRQSQMSKSKTISPKETTPTAVANNVALAPLTISSPKDGAIVTQNTVTINGVAAKNSLIVIQSPTKDMAFNNDKGDFSVDFPLSYGENVIRVAAYPKNAQVRSQEKELRVYYLPETL